MKFLKLELHNEDCILANRQGSHKRQKSKIDLKQFFSPELTELVEIIKNNTYRKVNMEIPKVT